MSLDSAVDMLCWPALLVIDGQAPELSDTRVNSIGDLFELCVGCHMTNGNKTKGLFDYMTLFLPHLAIAICGGVTALCFLATLGCCALCESDNLLAKIVGVIGGIFFGAATLVGAIGTVAANAMFIAARYIAGAALTAVIGGGYQVYKFLSSPCSSSNNSETSYRVTDDPTPTSGYAHSHDSQHGAHPWWRDLSNSAPDPTHRPVLFSDTANSEWRSGAGNRQENSMNQSVMTASSTNDSRQLRRGF